MPLLKRVLRALPLLLLSPILMAISVAVLAITDLVWKVAGRKNRSLMVEARVGATRTSAVSIVIPNWNGRDLLEKYLPSVIASDADEIIVVDNGSTEIG